MRKKVTLIIAMMLLVLTASAKKGPKYVFYFIGDGMGTNQVMGVQYYLQDIEGQYGFKPLCFTQFPYTGLVVTYSANSDVTDSSAAGTALAGGKKTDNNVLGVLPDKTTRVESIAEMAHKKGKRVAIGTSVCIDHATPGCFYGHRPHRNQYHEIATQLGESGFDFFGGADFHTPYTKDNSDEGNYVQAEKAGYTIVHGYDEYKQKAKSTDKIILFDKEPNSDHYLSYAIDRKDDDLKLSEITEAAIDFMMKDPKKGFFMMMEGGRIDQACHNNDPGAYIQEMLDFDQAIKIAYDFYLKHPKETLIVITADHETGGLIPGNGRYELNLQALQHQTCSVDKVTERFNELRKNKKATWEDAKKILSDCFGLFTKVPVNWRDEAELHSTFEDSFRAGGTEQNWYGNNAKIAAKGRDILNKIAMISWASFAHSDGYVPVYAVGVGAQNFHGRMNNTDIPELISKAAGYKK